MNFLRLIRSPLNPHCRRAAWLASAIALSLLASGALAQDLKVEGAWARATVPGQTATGAFMTLSASKTLRLTSIRTPLAGIAEVHEMRMNGDVMTMSALKDGLLLPAGKSVALKPGGLHLMLMDLKAPLPKDSRLSLTLVLVDGKGQETQTEISVPVGMHAPETHSHSGH